MYLATLDCATSNPSLSSSPWMRGAPQSGFSTLTRLRDLNRSATNIPSACRITNIAINDAMILPYDANLTRIEFSEGIPLASDRVYFNRLVVVLHRDVLAGVVRHERPRHKAHHR